MHINRLAKLIENQMKIPAKIIETMDISCLFLKNHFLIKEYLPDVTSFNASSSALKNPHKKSALMIKDRII